jgi:septum formation protein
MILHQNLNDIKLVLASQSPRRQHLLKELGLPFELRHSSVDEDEYPGNLPFTEIPIYLAKKKAKPLFATLKPNEILITSDTIVWCNNRIVGKPADRLDAVRILNELSDNKHVVVTGVCLTSISKEKVFNSVTDVYFRALMPDEIDYYIDTFKPFDKAGAYGIQEWIGYVGVERIEGSFFNVMGLPIQKLYLELLSFIND